jgi:formate hydrogenlyase subunit 6/NADH:ubiquinone oxidoreductase subunit I
MIIKKNDLSLFIDELTKSYEIFAPVGRTFSAIKSAKEINLKNKTAFSARKLFFPNKEKLFSFKGSKAVPVIEKARKRILFGVRPCDMNALTYLDKLFRDDPYYREKRDNTLIFGFQCVKRLDNNCYCHITDTFQTNNYDLLFIESKNDFFIVAGSEKGKHIIKGFKHLKKAKVKDIDILMELIRKSFLMRSRARIEINDTAIDEFAKRCVSCSACNAVCPTCVCFFVEDKIGLDLTPEERIRHWDSCHLQRYTRVAGDFVFRPERQQRLKNWIHCKLEYSKDRTGTRGCVGCGRCVGICMVDINMFHSLRQ